jgi:uncharacterized UPF0160 family protein
MAINILVTHSGGFHADELLSSVVLTRLFPEASLMRSRDELCITPATDKIIYDVGGNYDIEAQIFDHHQSRGPLRDNGQPFSSFGLIWKHYGCAYLESLKVPSQNIDPIHAQLDDDFVLPIDLVDNGVIEPSVAGPMSHLTLPVLLDNLRPVFDDGSTHADDEAFFAALPIASRFLEAAIYQRVAETRARHIVLMAIAKAGKSLVLELPMGMPYRTALENTKADHILFVIYPRGNDWTLNGIKLSNNTFEQRADLPISWAGLRDAALENASGVKGEKFCHNARFIAIASNRDAILEMAEIAIKEIQ